MQDFSLSHSLLLTPYSLLPKGGNELTEWCNSVLSNEKQWLCWVVNYAPSALGRPNRTVVEKVMAGG